MEYTSITKTIRGHYANMKFWFISWKKDKNNDLHNQIKEAIAVLKELLARLLSAGCNDEERIGLATMNKEVHEIEVLINA